MTEEGIHQIVANQNQMYTTLNIYIWHKKKKKRKESEGK